MWGRLAALLPLGMSLLLSGCTPKTKLGGDDYVKPVARARVRTTQGSSVAVTQDERIAVVANRTDGIVSVLRIDPAQPAESMVLEQHTEIPLHPLNASQPWQVVIAPDDDTA